MVEIDLNMVPNSNASTYAKNNYTLEAMGVFNQNDILSLKAEGAQVQLVGNLRLVLFVAMPGEEQHFSIQVGTDDFSFDGLTFLMVPATLSQLDQIADLKDKKSDLESDYNQLSDAMDTMLNSLDGISSSLQETADGLDELNSARGTISAGKGQVYADLDTALGSLGDLAQAMEPAQQHLQSASQALTDINGNVNTLTSQAVSMKKELQSTQTTVKNLQKDISALRGSSDGSVKALRGHLNDLASEIDALQTNARNMKSALSTANTSAGKLTGLSEITIDGHTISEIQASAKTVQQYHDQYVSAVKAAYKSAYLGAGMSADAAEAKAAQDAAAKVAADGDDGFRAALTSTIHDTVKAQLTAANPAFSSLTEEQQEAAIAQAYQSQKGETIATTVNSAIALWDQIADGTLDSKLQQAEATNSMISSGNQLMSQIITLIGTLNTPTQDLMDNLDNLCEVLGDKGLTGDLTGLLDKTDATLSHLNNLGDILSAASTDAQTALDDLSALNTTANQYVSEVQQALSDSKTLAANAQTGLTDMNTFLSSLEKLSKRSGTQLDSGTQKTLDGLASTLRKAAGSLDTTDAIRDAKDSIDNVVTDTWNKYTGDVNNLLNMDSTASAVSLTSQQNPSPQSIQVLIRTEEIKSDSQEKSEEAEAEAEQGTFWSRVGKMFTGIWDAITGAFK
jgi:putative membrane protein